MRRAVALFFLIGVVVVQPPLAFGAQDDCSAKGEILATADVQEAQVGERGDDGSIVPDERNIRPVDEPSFLRSALSPDLLPETSYLSLRGSRNPQMRTASDDTSPRIVGASAAFPPGLAGTPITVVAISLGGFVLAALGIVIRDAYLRRKNPFDLPVASIGDGAASAAS